MAQILLSELVSQLCCTSLVENLCASASPWRVKECVCRMIKCVIQSIAHVLEESEFGKLLNQIYSHRCRRRLAPVRRIPHLSETCHWGSYALIWCSTSPTSFQLPVDWRNRERSIAFGGMWHLKFICCYASCLLLIACKLIKSAGNVFQKGIDEISVVIYTLFPYHLMVLLVH